MTKLSESRILSLFYSIVLFVTCIQSSSSSSSISTDRDIYTNIAQIHDEFWPDNYFNFPISIIESIQSMSHNWTENSDCLIELNAIRNGIQNSEEWAIKSKYLITVSI